MRRISEGARNSSGRDSPAQYLTESAKANYEQAFSRASYGFTEFKKEVLTWLTAYYGKDVKPGNKAIFIRKTSNGVDTMTKASSSGFPMARRS